MTLRRRRFARLVDRDVVAMRQRRLAIGDDQRIELDETVPLPVVVAGHFRPCRDDVPGLRRRQWVDLGPVTLPQLMRTPAWLIFVVLTIGALALFRQLGRWERRHQD